MSEEVTEGLTRRDVAGRGWRRRGMALAGGLLGRAIDAMGAPAVIGDGPHGPLGTPDANGLRLPAGFTSRKIARSGENIGPRPYQFHILPDGMGSFKTSDGGFILVSNSEAPPAGPGRNRSRSDPLQQGFRSGRRLPDPQGNLGQPARAA